MFINAVRNFPTQMPDHACAYMYFPLIDPLLQLTFPPTLLQLLLPRTLSVTHLPPFPRPTPPLEIPVQLLMGILPLLKLSRDTMMN